MTDTKRASSLRISNETKVGVLATIAIVLLVLGYNLMRGKNVFSKENIYYVRYDNAGGIAPAGHVRYKGMNVGHVLDIKLANDNSGKIVVSLAVTPDLKIPKGSAARVVSPDFISAKAVQLEFTANADYVESGDTLVAAYASNGLQAVQTQAEALIASLDSVVNSVNSVFSSEAKINLQKSIRSIESTLNNLDKSTAKLDGIMNENSSRLERIFTNVESITSNLNQNQDEINAILSNLSAVSDSVKRANIAGTFRLANEALQNVNVVMTKIDSGQGTLGLLVNDQKLYMQLDSASKSLDSLLIDLKANPNRYVHVSVFGKKDKPPKGSAQK